MKNKKSMISHIFMFILGGLVFGTIGVYAAITLASSSVSYSNTTSGSSSTNVQGAIDELYTRANKIIQNGEVIYALKDGVWQDDFTVVEAGTDSSIMNLAYAGSSYSKARVYGPFSINTRPVIEFLSGVDLTNISEIIFKYRNANYAHPYTYVNMKLDSNYTPQRMIFNGVNGLDPRNGASICTMIFPTKIDEGAVKYDYKTASSTIGLRLYSEYSSNYYMAFTDIILIKNK